MKLRCPRVVPLAGPLMLLGVMGGLAGCAGSAVVRQPRSEVHLIVDVGSSGTSLCMFPIRVGGDGQRCAVGNLPPVCAKAKGGLAALTHGQTPAAVAEIVRPRLLAAWQALGDVSKGGRPEWRAQVRAVAALGTGGFRDLLTGQPESRPEWSTIWRTVEQFFAQDAQLPSVVARPITGSEEGLLAWRGVRESEQPKERFAIMEVGGATVQFALAESLIPEAEVVAVSDGRGMDVTFDRMTADRSQRAEFSVCYSPEHPERQNGLACIDLLWNQVFADSRVAGLAAVTSARRVYALGAPWLGLLRELPTVQPWQIKATRDLPSQVRLGDLVALAEWICPKPERQLVTIAPHSFEVKRRAGRTCYSIAYHAAYFRAIAPAATAAEIYPGGDEQWARGAAISGEFFAACRAASAK